MRESVSAIFIFEDDIFIIKRQDYLRAFPGYYSFPGGKVDEEDKVNSNNGDYLYTALNREVEEELGISLDNLKEQGLIDDIVELGIAVTPDFNPHRFSNHYFKIFLNSPVEFNTDDGEVAFAQWLNVSQAFTMYRHSKMLVVPPMITILEDLAKDITSKKVIDPNLKYCPETEVPLIKPLADIGQFLPLSNTFPPANRTNSFYIGDDRRVLIDPSPKDEVEYGKFLKTIKDLDIDIIFLTHHHPDHHEYSTNLALKFKIPMGMSEDTHQRLLRKMGSDYFRGISIEIFKEGDVLTSCQEHKVLCLETPGHDEGQISLYREDGAWAIVSDLIQTVGTVTVGGEEADMHKYFKSLRRIIDLNPKVTIPSHGISIGGVHRIVQTLKHRLGREQQVKNLLDQGKNSLEIVNIIYPELPKRLHRYALETIESHISKLRDHGEG